MTHWEPLDVVTTTFRTIHQIKQDSFREGRNVERERVLSLSLAHEFTNGEHLEDCITCTNIQLIKGEEIGSFRYVTDKNSNSN